MCANTRVASTICFVHLHPLWMYLRCECVVFVYRGYCICAVFVLYLYCICIAGRGWVEKLQSALTPLGTPKDARWQLSAMKGSTLLLLLYRDWILAKSFKPMTSFQTTFYSFRGFHFNRIKTSQPAISNI